jgi:hypothetical protein
MDDKGIIQQMADWARLRLDEIDAGVVAMEQRLRTIADEGQLQAHLALLEARKAREAYRIAFRNLSRATLNDAAARKEALDLAWGDFQRSADSWVAAAGHDIDDLKARARAQAEAWERILGEYRARLMERAEDGKARMRASVEALEEASLRQKETWRKLEAAGGTSFAAWSTALGQARDAFDEALKVTKRRFKEAVE